MKKLSNLFNYILIKLFSFFPIQQNCIVLHSVPDFSDNAWAFYKFLIDNNYNEQYRIIWLVKNPKKYPKLKNVAFISNEPVLFWLKRDFYLATAHYVIFTHSSPLRGWRKKQLFICTTHSASQLKAGDIRDTKKQRIVIPDYKLRCGEDGLQRMMLVTGLPEEKFVVIGMPRLDLLYKHKDCISVMFPGIEPKRVVIALETFKQSKNWKDSSADKSLGLNILTDYDDIVLLENYLVQNNVLLIIKPHPLQDLSYIDKSKFKNIKFISDQYLSECDVQLYELVENCDALLTDYSSIYYDYLLLDRPIGFMIKDMDDYKRGFIIENPLEEMTGKKIQTVTELIDFFNDIITGKDEYSNMRKSLAKRVFKYQDNRNCERLLSFIEKQNDRRKQK